MSTVVRTSAGAVRGVRTGRSVVFRGIPYAAAPFGELRLAAPAPHPGWDGVRPAVENGATPSLGPTTDTYSIPEPVVAGDEILNLNVFTPDADPAARLPVYVWVHGGGYVGGSPGGPWFDGASFNARGVVVVTITYRLGFEGYGHVPGAPDNRALRDCVAALEWVAQNIASFGGDPDRVTVGGQSAGGGATLALLAAPSTHHLFRAAVVHSAPLPDIDASTAERTGAAMARACGVEHTVQGWRDVPREAVVAAERSLDRADLWSAVTDLYRVLGTRAPVTDFGPVLDGDLIPRAPLEAYAAGTGAGKPLLIGSTSHEFNLVTAHIERFLAHGVGAALLAGLGVAAPLARAYPRAHPELSPAELLGQAVTDRVFRVPTVRVGLARSPAASQTWLWDFRWRSTVSGRSVHCLDLPFAWHVLGAERVARLAGDDPPERLADEMHGAIVDFVVTGAAPWPTFSTEAPAARVFDEVPWTGRDPYRFERLALDVLPT